MPPAERRRQRLRLDFRSLRVRLLFLLSFTLLPIGVIALANAYLGYQHYRSQIAAGAIAEGEEALRREEGIIERATNLLSAIAAMPAGGLASDEHCRAIFGKLLPQYPEFANISVLNEKGEVLCSATEGQGGVSAPLPSWFQETLKGRSFIVGTLSPETDANDPAIPATTPLTDGANNVTGVLAIWIRLAALEHTMRDVSLPEGGGMLILDSKGNSLAQRSNQARSETWLPVGFLDSMQHAGNSSVFDATGKDGVERRYIQMPLAGDLVAVFGVPVASIGDAAHFLLYSSAAAALLMWVAALITAAIAIGYLVIAPLRRTRNSMVAYTSGDVHARVLDVDDLPGEIQVLATTFNHMADTIGARDDALRAAVAHQRVLTREVHHRVRNNLQIINSLMNLQSWRAETPSEIATFSEVQRRVTALGLVHGAIYQGDDLRSVRLKTLLTDLCAATEQSLSELKPFPLFEADADEINASPDIAVPLAFLVTEIIGEATLRRNGAPPPTFIRIELRKAEAGGVLIVEADTPLFEPPQHELQSTRNGLNLLAGLVRQLGGSQYMNSDGTIIRVTIPKLSASPH